MWPSARQQAGAALFPSVVASPHFNEVRLGHLPKKGPVGSRANLIKTNRGARLAQRLVRVGPSRRVSRNSSAAFARHPPKPVVQRAARPEVGRFVRSFAGQFGPVENDDGRLVI